MLCLTRYPEDGQRTVVLRTSDGLIAVHVIEVRGQRVKLGFDAPGDVVIVREEIQDRYPLGGADAGEWDVS